MLMCISRTSYKTTDRRRSPPRKHPHLTSCPGLVHLLPQRPLQWLQVQGMGGPIVIVRKSADKQALVLRHIYCCIQSCAHKRLYESCSASCSKQTMCWLQRGLGCSGTYSYLPRIASRRMAVRDIMLMLYVGSNPSATASKQLLTQQTHKEVAVTHKESKSGSYKGRSKCEVCW